MLNNPLIESTMSLATHSYIDKIATDFVDSQRAGVTIPIVGDGVFSYVGDDGIEKPLLSYVVDRFREEYGDDQLQSMSESDFGNRADLFALTCISHKLGNRIFEGKYKKYIDEASKADLIVMERSVLKFLHAFEFPLIVTTACFNYVEKIINRDATVKYETVNYERRGNNARPDLLENISSTKYVYHLFGSADSSRRDWVYNEDILLDFLHNLHSTDYTCKNLSEYASETRSSILLLGCGLPDWLFRFIWYPIGHSDQESRDGLWLRNDDCNPELNHFLQNIRYSPVTEVNEFLTRTTEIKESEKNHSAKSAGKHQRYDFFISYAGEDRDIAVRLYENLLSKGYVVWFDQNGESEIRWGAKYTSKFSEGINVSEHAITIITENYIRGVQDTGRGLCTETRLIKEKALRVDSENFNFVMPLIIEVRLFNNRPLSASFIENWAGFVTSIEGGLGEIFTGTSMRMTSGDNPQIPTAL